ncbi:interferon-induced very large GTPase 1-like [Dendronephthya gigantea]|uniref:interferon-induced very large GTPase 1-like n=1 Tax=Dendronephthya gigantea TaxID=151771 RepID=UPI001069F46A|nr:interferon-induced very large GTPase 1-like [Dendronephthya gigantea]
MDRPENTSRSKPIAKEKHKTSGDSKNSGASSTKAQIDESANKDQLPHPPLKPSPLVKLCNDLNLEPNSKFTLKHARTVDNHTLTDKELQFPKQIPEYIFKTILIANYHVRDFKVKAESNKNKTKCLNDSDEREDEEEGINPMDALLCIYHLSDSSLRRYLALKLAACQLSIPFLLPDPEAPSERVTMLTSSLKGITKTWKSSSEVFVTEHQFPVVSFIRIGEISTSKSSLINKIMSDGSNHHDFFFHEDMEGGYFERKIVDGLVELSWYLPGENEKQTFQREICFANLRGDSGVFKKQRNVLFKISSVLCILLPSNYPDEIINEILKEAKHDKAKIILIFPEKTKSKRELKDLEESKHREKFSLIKRLRRTNEHEFVTTIQKEIEEKVNEIQDTSVNRSMATLGNLAPLVKDDETSENDETQSEFEKNTCKWLEVGIEKAKDLLALQAHVPELADLERQKYHPKGEGDKSVAHDRDNIYKRIEGKKDAQKTSFKELDKRVLDCFDSLAKMKNDPPKQVEALIKLKHKLNKMSLDVVAELRGKDGGGKVESLQELKEQQLKLFLEKMKLSFGLEHIVREFAQLYQLKGRKYDFAEVAVEMLLSGNPVEILDGDSSYIPLEWFKAVYTKLESKTKNAKIFVISVLGIQSSGKSTMLNTMFGLEFPVSAGRCTRGAFASLLPVSDSLKDASNFDYILVVDTEGLRGSGDPQIREHDNELATFVIGVANLTIVNIMGENHEDMKEFLEIAMHAFLKMKLVKEKKICKIVHHNVAAADARDKLTADRLNLKRDLDKMAQLAALQENCEEKVKKLDDIMSFNENEDVFYIPGLLQGNPPMAPVNPKYGRAIQKVKENIVSVMSSKQGFPLSVSQFRDRVCNLWTAMLKENFIFNFRNVIEVRAFTALDKKFFEESVNLMTGMSDLKTEIEVALERCTKREERDEKWNSSQKQIGKRAQELGKKMETAMKTFFETNEDKATLEQWRENFMRKIQLMEDNQRSDVVHSCSAAYHHLQNQHDVKEKEKKIEKEFLQKATIFITSVENADDTEQCLATFEQEWGKWMMEVPDCKEKKTDVNNEMVEVLFHTDTTLKSEMSDKLDAQNDTVSKFKGKVPDYRSNPGFLEKFINKLRQNEQGREARIIVDKAFDNAIDFAKNKAKSRVRCTRNDLTTMYHKIITTIDNESKKPKLKIDNSFKCDILLYIFANAYDIFEEMEQRYLEGRDIKGDLERTLRPTLEIFFQNSCQKVGKELRAAISFINALREPIKSALNRAMGPAVAKKLMEVSTFQSKAQFHASVLIELGKGGKFESYIPYLQNSVKFLKTKLVESSENYCIKENPTSIRELLEIKVNKIKGDVSNGISMANEETKRKGEKLTFWIQQFVEDCPSLAITKEMFAVAAIDDDLKDIDVFETKVKESIDEFFKSLIPDRIDRSTMEKWDPPPHDQLLTRMFGCESFCPFCKGLCDQTTPNHPEGHSTKHHRAGGLNGYKDIDTKILSISICTNDVAEPGKRFRNKDTNDEWRLYSDYQSVNEDYKSWSIPPDPSFELSIYWQWFMGKFLKELCKHYGVKEPEIPSIWKDRTFEVAERDLRQEYNMLLEEQK